MKWVTLIITGLFCTLASFAYGTTAPVTGKPVHLWRMDDVKRVQCGEDWLCLVAWAEGQRK